MRRRTLSAVVLALSGGACAATEPSPAPPGFELLSALDFEQDGDGGEFLVSDPNAWRVDREGRNGFLELFSQSAYLPQHRSPLGVALLAGPVVGDFVLEVDVQQTGRDYDHRDLCVFFGVQDPDHYYYAHLATRADDSAHHIQIVDGADRRPVTTSRTFGVDWGRGEWRHLRVVRELRNGRVRVWFGDGPEPVLEARDVTFGPGWVGLGSFDDTGRFDNLRLWAPTFEVRSPGFFRAPRGAR